MKKHFVKGITILISFSMSISMHAQQNFESYIDKVFLNVFSKSSDSDFNMFLSEFVPLHSSKNVNKWTAYPDVNPVKPIVVTHSYFFHQHPFIVSHFEQGEFKVYTSVKNDSTGYKISGINDFQLLLGFEKLSNAIEVFEKLRKDLLVLGHEQTFYKNGLKLFSEIYSHEIPYNTPARIRFGVVQYLDMNNLFQLSININ